MGYALLDSRDIVAGFYPKYEASMNANWANEVGMVMQSDQETNNYVWLGQSAGMREWLGGRQEQVLNRFRYQLTNKIYEDTMAIMLEDLRRDKTGQLRIRIADMASKAAGHW